MTKQSSLITLEGKLSSRQHTLIDFRFVDTRENISGLPELATAANTFMAVFFHKAIPSKKKSFAGSTQKLKRIFEISINF